MKEFLVNFIVLLFLFSIFVSGFYINSDYFESKIKKNQAIYISDVEYRCNEIKR